MIKIKKFPFAPKGDMRSEKWNYLDEATSMSKYIKNGDVIYDCGANIFDHSIFFALNYPNSKIVSFEPISEYFEMGLKNMQHYGVKNIVPLNVALGDQKTKMNISIDNEGSSLVFDHKNNNVELISVETIDFLVENELIPAPDVIKIDVEGFALPLLKGAANTIKKYKPSVIIEIHPLFVGDEEAKAKIHLLQEFGLGIVEQLGEGREFVMTSSKGKIDIDKIFNLKRIDELRNEYDSSNNKSDRTKIIIEYNKIKEKQRIPFSKKMIWSRLFIFFSFLKKK